jgi:hypothetical protein
MRRRVDEGGDGGGEGIGVEEGIFGDDLGGTALSAALRCVGGDVRGNGQWLQVCCVY